MILWWFKSKFPSLCYEGSDGFKWGNRGEGNKQKDVEQEKPMAKHTCEKTGNKKSLQMKNWVQQKAS